MNGREGSPSLEVSRRGGSLVVTASGTWSLRASASRAKGMEKAGDSVFAALSSPESGIPLQKLELRAENLEAWDSSLLALFAEFSGRAEQAGLETDYTSLPEGMAALLDLAGAKRKRRQGTPTGGKKNAAEAESLLELIGGKTLAVPGVALSALNFIGEVSASFARLCMGRAAVNARDVWRIFRQCGVDALAIVSLTSLLLGLILAFVSALQLRAFGAEIYVSALVSVSMVRVMGPVLTGIVLAGRTGASFAAIIGSMQANEEVDALVTFGLDPVDFLVLPRVLGLALMTPLLTVYADVMGILGGFLVGTFMMDISPSAYWENTLANMSLSQIWIGLLHALVFGFVVSVTGCYQGLKAGRNVEAVGQATTAAVVNSIVGIIVSTSIITIMFTAVSL
mgnify:FL=1